VVRKNARKVAQELAHDLRCVRTGTGTGDVVAAADVGHAGVITGPGVTALSSVSPRLTQLNPFRFIDINIDAAREFSPLKRVYISDQQSYGSVRNDLDITRTRLLSTQPVRVLERLHATITLENGELPPDTGLEHDL
jgi:hypothetical protein